MSSLKPVQAFLSYARSNESDSRLAGLRQRLQDAICAHTGLDVQIFQDTADLCRGDRWEERIRSADAGSLFLIPVVTPRYFRSEPCRAAYYAFSRARAEQTGILPIYYVEAYEMEYSAWLSEHEWAGSIADCLWMDFRELRSRPLESSEVQNRVTEMAIRFRRRLEVLGALGPARPTAAAPKRRSVGVESPATLPNTPVVEAPRASAAPGRVVVDPLTQSWRREAGERSRSNKLKHLPGGVVVIALLALASVAFRRSSEPAPPTVVSPLVPYETRSVPLPPGLRPKGFSRDGAWLAAEGRDGKLALFEVGRPDRAPRTVDWEPTRVIAIAPNRSMIAAARGARLTLYDLKAGTNIELPHDGIHGPVSLLEFNSVGSVLAIAGRDGGVLLVSIPEPFEALPPMSLDDSMEADGLAFDFESRRLAVASKQLAKVAIYDLHAAELDSTTLERPSGPFLPHSMAFSPDGLRLASGDALNGNVRIWEIATGTIVQEYRATESSVESLSFDLEGKRLVSLGEEGTLRVWNTLTETSDVWLPEAVPDGFAAVFLGSTLYTSAAITNEPGLLVWVHDRLGGERGVDCRLMGAAPMQQVSDRHGACLFSRLSPGKYTLSAGMSESRAVEVHSPLVLSVSTSGGL